MGHALSAAGILWSAGMGILALYSLAAYIRLRRRVRTAVRLEGSVYVSEFADTPFILGIARPRIYLPSGMPEEMRALVLAHEQAHLRRLDNPYRHSIGFPRQKGRVPSDRHLDICLYRQLYPCPRPQPRSAPRPMWQRNQRNCEAPDSRHHPGTGCRCPQNFPPDRLRRRAPSPCWESG